MVEVKKMENMYLVSARKMKIIKKVPVLMIEETSHRIIFCTESYWRNRIDN